MLLNINIKNLFNCFLYGLNPRIAKFKDFACIGPDLNDAAQAYNQDPSTENCNEYKAVLLAYINNGCAGMDQSAYAELDALPCN